MKKCKKPLLAFLLAFILSFTALPFSAQAADYNLTAHTLIIGGLGAYADNVKGELPLSLTIQGYEQSKLRYFHLKGGGIGKIPANSTCQMIVVFNDGTPFRVRSFSSFELDISSDGLNVFSKKITDFTYNPTLGTAVLKFTLENEISSNAIFTLVGNFSNSSSPDSNAWFKVSSVQLKTESEESGFFNSIIEFFKELFTKLETGITNIGSWFSELGDKLSSGFSNLIDNIKNFFSDLKEKLQAMIDDIGKWFSELKSKLQSMIDDIGKWFSEIGDRISGFFENLWNNISEKVESITITISDWWQGIKAWFRSLFVPEDGFFDKYKNDWETWGRAHFALLYEVNDFFDLLFEGFDNTTKSGTITIPQVKLPESFGGHVIIKSTVFDFDDLINGNQGGGVKWITWVYTVIQILISAIAYALLIKYLLSTFSLIIAGDKEAL